MKAFEQENQEIIRLREMVERQGRILEDKKEMPAKFEKWRKEGQVEGRKQSQNMPKLEIEGLGSKVQAFD